MWQKLVNIICGDIDSVQQSKVEYMGLMNCCMAAIAMVTV